MKIDYSERNSGKTTRLLQEFFNNKNSVLVVPTSEYRRMIAQMIYEQTRHSQYELERIFTFYEIARGRIDLKDKDILIDELGMCLQTVTNGNIKLASATKSEEHVREEKEHKKKIINECEQVLRNK